MGDSFFYEHNTFTKLKRKIFTNLLPIFILSFLIILLLLIKDDAMDTINIITFFILLIGLTFCFLLLFLNKELFRYIEIIICFIASFIYIFRVFNTILIDLGVAGNVQLGSVAYWSPIVYILLFFTFRGSKAYQISWLIYAITLIPGIYHIFLSDSRSIPTLDALIQFYIANLGVIISLFYLQRVLETYLQAEASQQLAYTDYLTSLPNRRKMDALLHQEIKRARKEVTAVSAILFDVDYFKKVNDRYGHDVGDSVLRELTYLINGSLEEADHFGRWGGEEFLIIAVNKNLNNGAALAERLRTVVENHKFDTVGFLTCSFGVSELNDHDLAKDLLKRADIAMYQAKETGRNRIVTQ
ncbi:GGDEF domain-containing protein [Mesobacillus harenae]|uniref:GGDEF domain-containing protein n=1 Tax=Mesobacillus harenae TaxID=2213203 RepID=UPI001580B901|nr:GGDEF domain-containing protein [Mesobacillus harenae]